LFGAAAIVFLASGARVAVSRDARTLDAALVALVAVILLQLVPLPSTVVDRLSPHAQALQQMLSLAPSTSLRSLTIDVWLTRNALAACAAAILVFFAARETFSEGGVRLAARAIAYSGLAAAVVGLIQRATAPTLLLWTWRPTDPGAQPYGPFVNRNHFATWLLLAGSLTAGYLIAHVYSHATERPGSRRLLLRDLLADGDALLLAGSLAFMALALAGSLSRSALLGAATALAFGVLVAGRRERSALAMRMGGAALIAVVVLAVWANREGLVARVDATLATTDTGRTTIWRETVPVIRDFWLTGTGAGTYAQSMLKYQTTTKRVLFNQAHNEYLQLLAEGGLLLSVPALVALLAWIRIAWRRLQQETQAMRWVRTGAAAGIAGLAVQSLFETGLRMPANAMLFALLAAIVVHEPRKHS
jgi:O-antigen ligase